MIWLHSRSLRFLWSGLCASTGWYPGGSLGFSLKSTSQAHSAFSHGAVFTVQPSFWLTQYSVGYGTLGAGLAAFATFNERKAKQRDRRIMPFFQNRSCRNRGTQVSSY